MAKPLCLITDAPDDRKPAITVSSPQCVLSDPNGSGQLWFYATILLDLFQSIPCQIANITVALCVSEMMHQSTNVIDSVICRGNEFNWLPRSLLRALNSHGSIILDVRSMAEKCMHS